MSQTTPDPQDLGTGFVAPDGSRHGPQCYDGAGRLTCAWPEQHYATFAVQAPLAPRDEPVEAVSSAPALLPVSLDPVEEPESRASVKRTRWRSRGLTALVVIAAVAAVAIGVGFRVADLHLQTVLTGSMRPTASPGDVAVTQGVPIDSLRVGDVIAFFPPGQTTPVLHRLRSLKPTATGLEITTKGDANSVDDPWLATLQGKTAYRLVAVVPFIGWSTELQRPALLAAGLLLGLAILLEIRKEVRTRRKKSRTQS